MFPHTQGPKAPAQGQAFNHNHTTAMAKIAAGRAQARRVLSGAPPGFSGAPQMPAAPTGGSYKGQIAGALAQRGLQVGVPHIHAAIDALTRAGRFTPFQGQALKAHNGPLEGPQGQATMGAIAGALMPKASSAPQPPQAPGM